MEELIEAVSEVYEATKELALTAAEFDMYGRYLPYAYF